MELKGRRREMWLNIEIMSDDTSFVRSMLQDDLHKAEVGQVNEENGELVARAYLRSWANEPGWEPPTASFDWYRVTITDQFSGEVVYCMTTKRLV